MLRLRRLLSCILLTALLFVQLPTAAQSTSEYPIKELSIRINNPGAKVTAKIVGKANELLTLELVRPNAKSGDGYSEEGLTSAFAGLDMIQLDENGEATYQYTADDVSGIYTLRVRGEVTSLSYTDVYNEPQGYESDAYYADMWSAYGSTAENPYTQDSVWLTPALLKIGLEHAAQSIKAKLDKREPGRRLLMIDPGITTRLAGESVNFIWEQRVVENVAADMEEFFDYYYHIGGQLDGLYSDDETTMCTWTLDSNDKVTAEEFRARIDAIVADPFYQEYIRPQLVERGMKFSTGDGVNELQILRNQSSTSASNTSYMIWGNVMHSYKSECLKKAFYEPAAKFFPEVTYANYGSNDRYAAYYTGGAHRYHLGGNVIKAGTHSSPVLYTESGSKRFSPNGDVFKYEATPFAEVLCLTNSMREIMLSSEGGKTMPWVVAKGYNFSRIDADETTLPYYYEYMIHLAMCDPDAFLFYGPGYYTTDDPAVRHLNYVSMNEALNEINTYMKKSGAKTLVDDTVPIDSAYILSGIESDGKYVWRITPDNTHLSAGQSFCTKTTGTPTFYIDGTTISFPQGTILPNINETYGYWVETPLGVYPEIKSDTLSEAPVLQLIWFDKNGIQITDSETPIDAYSAKLYFKDSAGRDITVNFAQYMQNKMVNVQTVGKSKLTDKAGTIFIEDLKGNTPADTANLYIWENFNTMRPITESMPVAGNE